MDIIFLVFAVGSSNRPYRWTTKLIFWKRTVPAGQQNAGASNAVVILASTSENFTLDKQLALLKN